MGEMIQDEGLKEMEIGYRLYSLLTMVLLHKWEIFGGHKM